MKERIKELRKSLRLSRDDFGNALGVSRDVIANIELDRLARPEQKEPLVRLICETFNVSYVWLTTGQGSMRAETKQSFLEELSGEYGLSFTAQKIIESYLNSGAEQRAKMDAFLNEISNSLSSPQPSEEVDKPNIAVVDNVIDVYKAAASTSGKEHGVVTETTSEIERLKGLPRVTNDADF